MSVLRSRDELWDAVNAALDARRDPLRDEDVRRWLVEHPEDLGPIAALDRGLRALAPRRRVAPWIAAAATVLAVAAWTWVRRVPASRSCVVDYRLSVVTETPVSRTSAVLENGRFSREHVERLDSPLLVATITTGTRKEGHR